VQVNRDVVRKDVEVNGHHHPSSAKADEFNELDKIAFDSDILGKIVG
jgi:hypothetical protein